MTLLAELRKRDLLPRLLQRVQAPDPGLYVYRDILNGDEILAWAKSRGITNLLPPEELHVTIVHSSHAIAWVQQENTITITSAAWRHCQSLGDKNAVVVVFDANILTDRWQEACDAGAIWDYQNYNPHVTLSYGSPIVPRDVPTCDIVLGPEKAEAVDSEWADAFRLLQQMHVKAPITMRDLPQLQRLAERLEPALRRAFLAAVAKLQNSIDLEKLAAAINANQLTAAEAAAQISTFPEVYGGLAAELRAGFLVGSSLAIRELAQQGISLSFNLVNPKAVDYASRATLDLVQPFQQNAKETIRTFLAKALSGETTPSGAAKDIKDLIGLDPNRVRRADKFWQKLVEQDVPDRDIQRRVGRYMDSLLRERAEVIARNEIHKAAGAGQQVAWDSAAQTGLIDKAEYSKVWIVTWDEVLCDLCEPMDGQVVGMDEPFDTPNGPQDFPDMHVQCRCTATLVKTDEVDDYVSSLNRPDEKPQSRR
jgi:hypothetical protein